MNYELFEKVNSLAKRYPLKKSISNELAILNKFDFVRSSLDFFGLQVEKKSLYLELTNKNPIEISSNDRKTINIFVRIYQEMFTLLSMRKDLDNRFIKYIFSMIKGIEENSVVFRSDNSIIKEFLYTPKMKPEVLEMSLDALFRKFKSMDFNNDIIEEVTFINNGIVSLAPFNEYLGLIAMISLEYQLLKRGFYILPINYKEYIKAVKDSIREINFNPVYEFLTNIAIKKTDVMNKIIDTENIK